MLKNYFLSMKRHKMVENDKDFFDTSFIKSLLATIKFVNIINSFTSRVDLKYCH